LIEGIVRIVACAGDKSSGEGELASGDLFHFVVCELASALPAEHPVIVIRHGFLLSSGFHFLLQTRWRNQSSESTHLYEKRLTEQSLVVQQINESWFPELGLFWNLSAAFF
jgi:hypothetical protein